MAEGDENGVKKDGQEVQEVKTDDKEVIEQDIRDLMAPEERASQCAKEIDSALDRWNCILSPYVIISGAATTVHCKILPRMERVKKQGFIPVINPNPENENDPSKYS